MNFEFASPWYLLLLALVPLLALYYWRAGQRAKPATLSYGATGLAKGLGQSWKIAARPLLYLLRLATIALIAVALARPQMVRGQETITGEGIEIALALDLSGSMAALDFQPDNRLAAAKSVITDFIGERPYDKIGLVVFASDAFNLSPLTLDHTMVERSLEQAQLAEDLGLEDGTAIGLGIANAANMLAQSSGGESKVVILLTDGVNNAGEIDPLTAAEAARALGIKVYTLAAAKRGQVPFPMDGLFGEQIVYQESAIDEATLQQVADITGGKFYRAEDTAMLQAIYDEINQLERSQVEVQVFNQYQELMAWLLIPALLLLLLELVLRHTVFRTAP
jgi:Ca-activated chloride channel family protein